MSWPPSGGGGGGGGGASWLTSSNFGDTPVFSADSGEELIQISLESGTPVLVTSVFVEQIGGTTPFNSLSLSITNGSDPYNVEGSSALSFSLSDLSKAIPVSWWCTTGEPYLNFFESSGGGNTVQYRATLGYSYLE